MIIKKKTGTVNMKFKAEFSPGADHVRTLFIEPFSGISGNMILGALIDTGLDYCKFLEALESLQTDEKWEIALSETERKGVRAKHLEVRLGAHSQLSTHRAGGHGRTLAEISQIIESARLLPDKVKENALGIFGRLASAESKVHGRTVQNVHFHEVGAIDAILDICGTCLALDMLGIGKVVSMPPPLGGGAIKTAHGVLPVPAPATLELMKGLPVMESLVMSELTTPTGAAILGFITGEWGGFPSGRIFISGTGAGTRDFSEMPNILRATIIVSGGHGDLMDSVGVVECNLDDFQGENFSWLGPGLIEKGAYDYAVIPVTSKKCRPVMILQVLCDPAETAKFADLLLSETGTLGVRFRIEKRKILRREIRKVKTPYGEISVKLAFDGNGRILKFKAESDECIALAKSAGKSCPELQNELNAYLAAFFKII